MRPFKHFFFLAIGLILLVFLAKVAFFAFILAAGMSIVFFIMRKIRSIFTHGVGRSYAYHSFDHHERFSGGTIRIQ